MDSVLSHQQYPFTIIKMYVDTTGKMLKERIIVTKVLPCQIQLDVMIHSLFLSRAHLCSLPSIWKRYMKSYMKRYMKRYMTVCQCGAAQLCDNISARIGLL